MTDDTTRAVPGADVALVSCTRCGVALVLDPAEPLDVVALHMAAMHAS